VESEGKLVDLPWNGDVRLALGAETRTLSGSWVPSSLAATGDLLGPRYVRVEGSYTVGAAWAELNPGAAAVVHALAGTRRRCADCQGQ
jgi:hypothetical protein